MAVEKPTSESMKRAEEARERLVAAGRRIPSPVLNDVMAELTDEGGFTGAEVRTAAWDALSARQVDFISGGVIVTTVPELLQS